MGDRLAPCSTDQAATGGIPVDWLILTRAALAQGCSVSDLIREAALERAGRILLVVNNASQSGEKKRIMRQP